MSSSSSSKKDIDTVREVLGCDENTAMYYLHCFQGDCRRTIHNVLFHGDDPNWWAHPTATTTTTTSDYSPRRSYCDTTEEDDDDDDGKKGDSEKENSDVVADNNNNNSELIGMGCSSAAASEMIVETNKKPMLKCNETPEEEFQSHPTSSSSSSSSSIAFDDVDLEDDRCFYGFFGNLVDSFVDAICSGAKRNELRNMITEADTIIFMHTGQQVRESNLVNRLCYKHEASEGRSPLSYAVAKNMAQQVYDLIDLGAEVSKRMMRPPTGDSTTTAKTALVLAATNAKRDGTDMVRVLLSKGAKPSELVDSGVDERALSLGMKYWIDKARRVGTPPADELQHMAKLPPMDRIHELDYAVVGEEAAVAVIQEALAARFGNPQGSRGKPLVMLFLGPPGHGKTYFSSNAARSLVGEDNFLFVPCQSIRDDADLFGSRLGGNRSGGYSCDGQLTCWLRERQGKKCVVFLDEFEKCSDLTSSLGWSQAKKIYQSFLEPWQDGFLSDQGALSGGTHNAATSAGGEKIDCSQCIWIMTANWGQRAVIDFCEEHKERMQSKVDQKDVAWIQKELVKKILRPLCMREFKAVHESISALCRRIDVIVPFLPFTSKERRVVADIAVSDRFSLYREPSVLTGQEEKRRSFGNLHLRSTRAFAAYAAECYDPMQGASGMLSAVQQADGKFQMMSFRGQLGLSNEQKTLIRSDSPPDANSPNEPTFWVHFDKDEEEICITQNRPVEDDGSDCSQHVGSVNDAWGNDGAHAVMLESDGGNQSLPSQKGASNDAF